VQGRWTSSTRRTVTVPARSSSPVPPCRRRVSREEAQDDIDGLIGIDREVAIRMIATSARTSTARSSASTSSTAMSARRCFVPRR
jgi:hypothetical protein